MAKKAENSNIEKRNVAGVTVDWDKAHGGPSVAMPPQPEEKNGFVGVVGTPKIKPARNKPKAATAAPSTAPDSTIAPAAPAGETPETATA
jgi:hypothetical protein